MNREITLLRNRVKIALDKLENCDSLEAVEIDQLNLLLNEVKKYNTQFCKKCEEWIQMDLPADCLCKPEYCIKDDLLIRFEFVYEHQKCL